MKTENQVERLEEKRNGKCGVKGGHTGQDKKRTQLLYDSSVTTNLT